jgi:predicted transcriptional regulator
MTVTVKLEPDLEGELRLRAALTGRTTSEVIRAALEAYLAKREPLPRRSAFDLGAGLFGQHSGPADLATNRKRALSDAWGEKHAGRRAR